MSDVLTDCNIRQHIYLFLIRGGRGGSDGLRESGRRGARVCKLCSSKPQLYSRGRVRRPSIIDHRWYAVSMYASPICGSSMVYSVKYG